MASATSYSALRLLSLLYFSLVSSSQFFCWFFAVCLPLWDFGYLLLWCFFRLLTKYQSYMSCLNCFHWVSFSNFNWLHLALVKRSSLCFWSLWLFMHIHVINNHEIIQLSARVTNKMYLVSGSIGHLLWHSLNWCIRIGGSTDVFGNIECLIPFGIVFLPLPLKRPAFPYVFFFFLVFILIRTPMSPTLGCLVPKYIFESANEPNHTSAAT